MVPRSGHRSALQRGAKDISTEKCHHDWGDRKTQLGKAIQEANPLRKKKTGPIEPECVTRREVWGNEAEIRKIDMIYKRGTPQREIDRRNMKLLTQERNITIYKRARVWAKSEIFKRKSKKNNICQTHDNRYTQCDATDICGKTKLDSG